MRRAVRWCGYVSITREKKRTGGISDGARKPWAKCARAARNGDEIFKLGAPSLSLPPSGRIRREVRARDKSWLRSRHPADFNPNSPSPQLPFLRSQMHSEERRDTAATATHLLSFLHASNASRGLVQVEKQESSRRDKRYAESNELHPLDAVFFGAFYVSHLERVSSRLSFSRPACISSRRLQSLRH